MDRSESDICFYFTVKILLYHTINLLKVTRLTITTFKPTKSTSILEKRLQYPTLTNIFRSEWRTIKEKTKPKPHAKM